MVEAGGPAKRRPGGSIKVIGLGCGAATEAAGVDLTLGLEARISDQPLVSNPSRVTAAGLAERHPQYRDQPFARVLVLRIVGVAGWGAATS